MAATNQRRGATTTVCENPLPHGSFGYASETYEVINGDLDHDTVSLPIADDIGDRQIAIPTIHAFRWTEDGGWQLEPNARLRLATRSVDLPAVAGRYVLVGASTNPAIRHAVSLFSSLRWALTNPEVREQIIEPICQLILCPGGVFQSLASELGAEHGLDRLYPGVPEGPLDPCERCYGIPDFGLPEWQIPPKITTIPKITIDPKFPGGDDDDCTEPPEPHCDLGRWLDQHLEIRQAIVWHDANDHPYDTWDASAKQELAAAFMKASQGQDQGLAAQPPATLHLFGSGQIFSTELAENDAWDYYIAHLGHSLYLEACRVVPWSILAMSPSERALLLDSDMMFHYVAARDTWAVLRDHNILFRHGAAMPGDPTRIHRDFMVANSLIESTQLSTIGRVLEWCRDNMHHFYGHAVPANMVDHWGYEGWPPVETVIAGSTYAPTGFAHYTAGCWGTAGFLRWILRTANIPATLERRCGHALPCFPTVDRCLSHGDDPYNLNTRTAQLPGVDMLIDGATFTAWFDPPADECANIGRTSRALG